MALHRYVLGLAVTSSVVLLFPSPAAGQANTRVSVDSAGVEADDNGFDPALTPDGRFVAFTCFASNLVAGDTNGCSDIFVHDRTNGTTERISVDSAGVEANRPCYSPSISADGRVIAFTSIATSLVPGDTNVASDIFVHDRATGITERVSVDSSGVEGNATCGEPSLSADGMIVAFHSEADNLVAGDTNKNWDVFVHDRATGITERVSIDSLGKEGSGDFPAISGDGQIVAFRSPSRLVLGDTNGRNDIYVHNRRTGLTRCMSVDSAGALSNGFSLWPSISADGKVVAFMSDATNLVSGDTNGVDDVFVHDRISGVTERVSVDSAGVEGNDDSIYSSLSADGRFVAFSSWASNFYSGDIHGAVDILIRDRSTGITELASVDASGMEGLGSSDFPSLSADGRTVAFESWAPNLVANDTNLRYDIFVHCSAVASWSNYGSGWPGTLGTPMMTANAVPVLGASVTITISNSLGAATPALLILGLAEANVPTSKDGTLLVSPLLFTPLLVPIAGYALVGTVPTDPLLCGLEIDLQTLEVDPGASKGVSFTDGLKLLLGH